MNRKVIAKSLRSRRAAAVVELAVCVPVVLLLAIAAMDFGRIAHHAEVVSNAARTGAECGATHGFTEFTRAAWEADVREAVVQELGNLPNFSESKLDYQLSITTDADDIRTIEMELTYPFESIVSWSTLPRETQIKGRVVFRQFR